MTELSVPQQVSRYLEREGITVQDFVGALEFYLDYSITPASFYQRHYALLKGKLNSIREEEERAYLAWMRVQQDPHRVGGAAHKLAEVDPERKVREIERWVQSKTYNRRSAERAFRLLKRALKGVQESLEG